MSSTTTISIADYMDRLNDVVTEGIAPGAVEIDTTGAFPRAGMDALGTAGLLGLISAEEVGGLGGGHREAAMAVERVAQACASTAMVLCMHYAGTAVIEALGPRDVREAIAAGKHLTTLAFSEAGSRSHFWAPVGTATGVDSGETVKLDARKSWATSSGHADSYVWSSKPIAAEGASTIWLVPSKAEGLRIIAPFNGLGMRGNNSSPVTAEGVIVPAANMLGADGGGFDVMMGVVLPYFQLMNAACSIGIMTAAVSNTAAHAGGTKYEYIGTALNDLPTIRAYIARIRIKTDMVRALLLDTLNALETGRDDTMLRVLEIKAAAGEAATEVTDIAMRVCGGAAFRKELGIERNFRDARAATVMAPTTDVLYDFIGKAVTGLPLF
ncbi:MAG: acyl-CoA dehydrogenase family protein, partial [Chloroflexota bacterium]